MTFFKFLYFLLFLWEFSSSDRVKTIPNENYFFFSFLACPDLFWLEMKPGWCLLIFLAFLGILKLGACKKGSLRRKYFPSFSACPDPFRLEMKKWWCFLIFLLFFWEFSSFGRLKMVPNEKIFFSLSACPDLFHLEMMPGWYFLIF